MNHIAKSPDRNTFQKEGYIQRTLETGKSLDDPEVQRMIKFYDDWKARAEELEGDPEWQQQNLEWDDILLSLYEEKKYQQLEDDLCL
jgi:hypothetical protein